MLISAKQAYLAALIFSSVLALSSFFGIIFFVSPADAGVFGVIILYAGFSVGAVSLGLTIWKLINRKKN